MFQVYTPLLTFFPLQGEKLVIKNRPSSLKRRNDSRVHACQYIWNNILITRAVNYFDFTKSPWTIKKHHKGGFPFKMQIHKLKYQSEAYISLFVFNVETPGPSNNWGRPQRVHNPRHMTMGMLFHQVNVGCLF